MISHEPALGTVPHPPSRPVWDCLACEKPWPCDPAREQLAVQYAGDRIGLSVYLGIQLARAAGEAPHLTAEELHERFVAWTR